MTDTTQAEYRQIVNQICCDRLSDALRAIDLKKPIAMIQYKEFEEDDANVRILYADRQAYVIDTGCEALAMLTDIINYLIEDEGPAELKRNPGHGEAPIGSYLCKVLELTDEGYDVVGADLWHESGRSFMSFRIEDDGGVYTTPVSDDGLLMIRDVLDYFAKEVTNVWKTNRESVTACSAH